MKRTGARERLLGMTGGSADEAWALILQVEAEARDREALRWARWLTNYFGMAFYVRHIRAEVKKRREGRKRDARL